MKYLNVVVVLAGIGFWAISSECLGDTAVSLDPTISDGIGWPNAGSNHGWQFTVNNSITLTQLGLYDDGGNGFSIDHPIGLWRLNDGTLLASGTINAGTVDPLSNNFRYIDVSPVTLSVGVNYVIGFYSSSAFSDKDITDAGGLVVNPVVNIVVARYDVAGQFQMPTNTYVPPPLGQPNYPDRFGPNFQFDVPEPATILLITVGGMFLTLRRNRRH